jgi:hypothetical protein
MRSSAFIRVHLRPDILSSGPAGTIKTRIGRR